MFWEKRTVFCQLFSDQPVLPEGWDVRHLWVAEILIATSVPDDSEFQGKADDPETLRRWIESHLAEMLDHKESTYFFPDDAFRDVVKGGLTDFLKKECSHIFEAFTLDPVLSVRPDGDTLIAVLKKNSQLREFVIEMGKRRQQSKCGCRERVS